jgi:hypothetical protein
MPHAVCNDNDMYIDQGWNFKVKVITGLESKKTIKITAHQYIT